MTPAILLAALVLAGAFLFIGGYFAALHPRPGTLDWIYRREARRPFTFAQKRHPMERRDALPVLLLTAVYAATAFFSLGDAVAPQSYTDFSSGEQVTVEIVGDPITVSGVRSYHRLGTGAYDLLVSPDGRTWYTLSADTAENEWGGEETTYRWAPQEAHDPGYSLSQSFETVLKWTDTVLQEPQTVRYFCLTGWAEDGETLQLGKLIFLDEHGAPISFDWTLMDGEVSPELFTADGTVPASPDWTNGTYFDEIYHARTALEHLENLRPYEVTHPPLGKLILSLGMLLFGVTPFGWRFMGTLLGVLMVPLLYILLKNLFGKTPVAFCGTALFTFDFMHLTQTRIATIDTYGVFFTLASCLFFYRWLTSSATPNKKGKTGEGWLSLALSGILWGVGIACKWTVVYAGAGLALLWLIHVIVRLCRWDGPGAAGWCVKTILWCLLFFVAVPGVVYTASYLPYAASKGSVTFAAVWDEMWRNQGDMFFYHQGVHTPHPYSSRWYDWLLDAKPILYFMENTPGHIRRFGAFNNPVLAWTGALSLIAVAVRTVQRKCGKGLFILIGFAAQFVPWMLIGRITFAYHYFPSTLFLALAVSYLMNDLAQTPDSGWKGAVYGLTAAHVGLYALFYPVLIGLTVPARYGTELLKFLPTWPW